MKKLIVVILLLSGCQAKLPQGSYEFNCEKDGVLSERHVNVQQAWQTRDDSFVIYYTDGESAYYRQAEGESCFVVEVR